MKDLDEMFLHRKPARILVGLVRGDGDKYASVLSKEADCTYSHTVKILDQFEENGLIEFTEEGRKKLIELTDRGERLADRMNDLMQEIDEA
ncbi:MAG: winged helix DNA-binding protein [Candidatus Nanohaloarchaea archaeon]|nr:winged helix DNA-binding protein [Candidatus Nanohaloarchaea archaeon]